MSILSPRYRTRQLLNKRWIAEFKKWPWSKWVTVSERGRLGIMEVYNCGDDGYDTDIWFGSHEEAMEVFSWLGVGDPDLVEEGEELFPEETVMHIENLDIENVGSRQHVHHEQNLPPEANKEGNPYVTGPSGGMASTF